jgi:hypothetical protein
MKNYIKYFNKSLLQNAINNGISEIENDTEGNYTDETGEHKQYCIEELVSCYEGQYMASEFCKMFDLEYNEEWIYEEIYNYFSEMADNLKKHVQLKPGYDLIIDFNQDWGGINIILTKQIQEEVEG